MANKITTDISNGMTEVETRNVINRIIESRLGPQKDPIETWGQARSKLNIGAQQEYIIKQDERGDIAREKINSYFNKRSTSAGKGFFDVNGKTPHYAFDYINDKCTNATSWMLSDSDDQGDMERLYEPMSYIDRDSITKISGINEKRVTRLGGIRGVIIESRGTNGISSPGDVTGPGWFGDVWDSDEVEPYLPLSNPKRLKNDSITTDKSLYVPVPSINGTGNYSFFVNLILEKSDLETANSIYVAIVDDSDMETTSTFIEYNFASNTFAGTPTITDRRIVVEAEKGPNNGVVYRLSARFLGTRGINQSLRIMPCGRGRNLNTMIIHGVNGHSGSTSFSRAYMPEMKTNYPADYLTARRAAHITPTAMTFFITGLNLTKGNGNAAFIASPAQTYLATGNIPSLKKIPGVNSASDVPFTYAITVDGTSAIVYDGTNFEETPGNFTPVYPIGIGHAPPGSVTGQNGGDIFVTKFALYENKFSRAELIELFDNMTDRIETTVLPSLTPAVVMPGEVISINQGSYGGHMRITGKLYFNGSDVSSEIMAGTYVPSTYGSIRYEETVEGVDGSTITNNVDAKSVKGIITPSPDTNHSIESFTKSGKRYHQIMIRKSGDIIFKGNCEVKMLLAGGAGSGGVSEYAPGGGSAGEIVPYERLIYAGKYNFSIGKGGPGVPYESIGFSGENSSFNSSNGSIVVGANGGGGGGSRAISGGTILTGGAGADSNENRLARTAILHQGGASFGGDLTSMSGGGGAGNGGDGFSGQLELGGNGGPGLLFEWTNFEIPLGGGGGGFNEVNPGQGTAHGTRADSIRSEDASLASGSGASRRHSGNGGDGFAIIVIDAEEYGVI